MIESFRRGPVQVERTAALLKSMPKIDLHTHLAGNVPEWVFEQTARKHGMALPEGRTPYDLPIDELGAFLVVYEQVADSFRTPEDLYLASYESLAADARASNLRYREVHYSPTINRHVDYADSIAAIAEGMNDAARDFGLDARIIIAVYRSQGAEVAEKLVADMIANPHPLVVGLGMEADEVLGPIEWFDRAYEMARDAGYQVTTHSGERAGIAEIGYSVDVLGCRRVDHGYAIARDQALAERLRDAGIHFATTWVSAAAHHGVVRDNPLRTMIDWGLDVSISSDDPGITRVSLHDGLLEAATVLELPDEFLVAQNRRGLESAWLDDATRDAIRKDLDAAGV